MYNMCLFISVYIIVAVTLVLKTCSIFHIVLYELREIKQYLVKVFNYFSIIIPNRN